MEHPLSDLSPKSEPRVSNTMAHPPEHNMNIDSEISHLQTTTEAPKLELERTPELFQQAILIDDSANSISQPAPQNNVHSSPIVSSAPTEQNNNVKSEPQVKQSEILKARRLLISAGSNGSQQIALFKASLRLRETETLTEIAIEDDIKVEDYASITICIEYDDKFSENLKGMGELVKRDFFTKANEITYHIDFDCNKKWSSYTTEEKESYASFLEALGESCAAKVTHCSVINKYDASTVFVTEKDELVKLGHEVQGDISKWTNLKIFDYGLNSLRFFPGVRFPDTLEVMHVGGAKSLETLAGFKMPAGLKHLDASKSLLTSVDYVALPQTMEHLILSDNSIYFLNYAEFPPRLQSLDLSNNRIDLLKNINFPKFLRYLTLSNNPIECIKGARFPESLEYLDISCIPNESMTGIKFPDLVIWLNLQQSMTNTRGLKIPPLVKELNMAGNGVNSINPLKLPNSIENLYLTDNNIKTLNKVTFPSCLKQLYLGNNLLTTLKNVLFPPTLEILDIEMDPNSEENEKFITSVKDAVFSPNLKVLNLGYHLIKTIESMDFPYSLEELRLQYNDLRVFRNVRFGPKLRLIDLSGNQDLYNIDGVVFPDSLKELRVPSVLLGNLPYALVERINKGEIKVTKSMPHTI